MAKNNQNEQREYSYLVIHNFSQVYLSFFFSKEKEWEKIPIEKKVQTNKRINGTPKKKKKKKKRGTGECHFKKKKL